MLHGPNLALVVVILLIWGFNYTPSSFGPGFIPLSSDPLCEFRSAYIKLDLDFFNLPFVMKRWMIDFSLLCRTVDTSIIIFENDSTDRSNLW
jgi:hypothetical protein